MQPALDALELRLDNDGSGGTHPAVWPKPVADRRSGGDENCWMAGSQPAQLFVRSDPRENRHGCRFYFTGWKPVLLPFRSYGLKPNSEVAGERPRPRVCSGRAPRPERERALAHVPGREGAPERLPGAATAAREGARAPRVESQGQQVPKRCQLQRQLRISGLTGFCF